MTIECLIGELDICAYLFNDLAYEEKTMRMVFESPKSVQETSSNINTNFIQNIKRIMIKACLNESVDLEAATGQDDVRGEGRTGKLPATAGLMENRLL